MCVVGDTTGCGSVGVNSLEGNLTAKREGVLS